MAQAKEMVSGTFRVDKGVKEAAEQALQKMGMSLSTGINVFLSQVAREQVLPFRPGEDTVHKTETTRKASSTPSARLEMALEESDEILRRPEMARSYESLGELLADL